MYKLISLLIIVSIGANLKAQNSESKLTEELEELSKLGYINGFSVAIVSDKTALYTRGFGYSDVKEKISYTLNTIQNIGSISKTFIGIALLKAQESGQLNLDDPINKYLPFKVVHPNFPEEEITIRHLATHTSGIKDSPRYYNNGYVLKEGNREGAKVHKKLRLPQEMMSLDDFLKKILSEEGEWYKKNNFSKKKPGAFFHYSNVGAGLAAYVLEKATNESFTSFTKKHIFDPLKMSATGWKFEDINIADHSRLYENSQTELAWYRLINYPDGGLITSAEDLSKYLMELIKGSNGNGEILEKASFKELFKPILDQSHFDKRNESAFNDEYNSSIFMGFSAKGYIGHSGSDPGVVTFMFFNPETQTGKLLLANTEIKKEGIEEFKKIWLKLAEYEPKLKEEQD